MYRPIALALLPLSLAAPALAQDADDPYAACAAMTDSTGRLACFDTTYAERRAGRAQRVEEARAENFGLAGSDIAREEASRAAQDEEGEEEQFTLVAAVSDAFVDGLGKHVLLLDNGQLWRETGGSTMRSALPRAGWQASIAQSWSGSYQMRFEGRRGYLQVTRVR